MKKDKFIILIISLITSCLTLSACNTEGVAEGLVPVEPPAVPEDLWWDVPAPDYTINEENPVITLNGEQVVLLNVGEQYNEQGATAADNKDGDLSTNIVISENIDINTKGDYLVRYQVSDSEGNNAIEQLRLVRVYDQSPVSLSKRPINTTVANFGYIEHLPEDYGIDPEQKFPLLIYNHGNGANTERASTDPVEALDLVISNGGPITLIDQGAWDNESPFIVLSPQAGVIPFTSDMYRLNAFVEFALHNYNVDLDRVYMVGWSQGGFLSYEYAVNFPEKIAAAVSVSAGTPYFQNRPSFFCDIETVPLWLLHGTKDEVVPYSVSTTGFGNIIDNCQPTELPKLTLVKDAEHELHHSIFDLSGILGNSAGYEFDERFDPYDQSIYQWLLSHKNN